MGKHEGPPRDEHCQPFHVARHKAVQPLILEAPHGPWDDFRNQPVISYLY